MKSLTLADVIAIVIFLLTPILGKLIEVQFSTVGTIISTIMPYLGGSKKMK